jgi:uncharacterized protein (TIGR03000 family)
MLYTRGLSLTVCVSAAAALFLSGESLAGGPRGGATGGVGYRGGYAYGYRGGYGYGYRGGYGYGVGVGIYIGGPYGGYPYGWYAPTYALYPPGIAAPGYVVPPPPNYLPPASPADALPAEPALGTQAPEPRRVEEPPIDRVAHIAVRAVADAEIWFGTQKTRQTGALREFVSPPLTPGQDYTYEVRARWTDDGKEMVQTRRITVSAGAWKTLDFTIPAPEAINSPRPVTP